MTGGAVACLAVPEPASASQLSHRRPRYGSLVIGLGELAERVGDGRAPALTMTEGLEPEVDGLAARIGRRPEMAARVVAEQIVSKDEIAGGSQHLL